MCDNKDSVVFLVCLSCHFSPFDGLGDEGNICYMCISPTHRLNGECWGQGNHIYFILFWSLSLLRGEWNCMKLVGQVNGLEK